LAKGGSDGAKMRWLMFWSRNYNNYFNASALHSPPLITSKDKFQKFMEMRFQLHLLVIVDII
jgi:hypothetical protein